MNGRHGNRRVFHPPSGAAGTNRPDADSPPHYDIGPFRLDTVARVLVRDADETIVWAEHLGLAFGEPVDIAPTRTDGPF